MLSLRIGTGIMSLGMHLQSHTVSEPESEPTYKARQSRNRNQNRKNWNREPLPGQLRLPRQNKKNNYVQKIFKTGAIFWEKARCVSVQLSKHLSKRPLSVATPLLDQAMDPATVKFALQTPL